MERRVVVAQYAAVEVGVLAVLLLHRAGVCVFHYLHRQRVVAVEVEQAGHITLRACEGALYAVYLLAVEVDVCLPVYAVEVEEDVSSLHVLRHAEGCAIPEIAVKERLRGVVPIV